MSWNSKKKYPNNSPSKLFWYAAFYFYAIGPNGALGSCSVWIARLSIRKFVQVRVMHMLRPLCDFSATTNFSWSQVTWQGPRAVLVSSQTGRGPVGNLSSINPVVWYYAGFKVCTKPECNWFDRRRGQVKAGPLRLKQLANTLKIWFVKLQLFLLWVSTCKDLCKQAIIVGRKKSGVQRARTSNL